MRGAVWWLEWRLALRRRRATTISVLVPLSLVIPASSGALAPRAAAAAYAVIFSTCAVVGAAVGLTWEGRRGMAERITRQGVPPWSYMLQRASAGAAVCTLELLPALAVAVVSAGARPAAGLAALSMLVLSAWVGGLLGTLLAGVSRSVQEAALFAGLMTILLVHASGAFREPAPGSLGGIVESIAPFRGLHEALLAVTSGGPWQGAGTLVGWAVALPIVVVVGAGTVYAGLLERGAGLAGIRRAN